VPTKIISTDPWTARMELADRCHLGRVFLIGDAAHLNPPFGGHGLNTGIGDAVDLGWKLAASLDGWGGPRLLDSYEAERRPLQQRVIAEAAKNMSVLSPQLLRDSMDDPGPLGEQTRLMVAEQIRATKSAEYFSLDLVLGHQYRDSPVLLAGQDDDRPNDDLWATTARPGRRIPHIWVSPGVSSLDLVGPGFTVIAADAAGADALVRAAADRHVPMTVHGSDVLATHFGAKFIVLRPDQVVAWCGDAAPPDAHALLDHVSGWIAADSCGTPTTTTRNK
jgi:FAD binding domain